MTEQAVQSQGSPCICGIATCCASSARYAIVGQFAIDPFSSNWWNSNDQKMNSHDFAFQNGWVGFTRIVRRKPMTASAFHNGYLAKKENADVCFESEDNGLDRYWGR